MNESVTAECIMHVRPQTEVCRITKITSVTGESRDQSIFSWLLRHLRTINFLFQSASLNLLHLHVISLATVRLIHHDYSAIHHSFALSLQAKTYFSSIFPTINCPHPSSGMTSLTFWLFLGFPTLDHSFSFYLFYRAPQSAAFISWASVIDE